MRVPKEKELLAVNEQVIFSFISWLAGIYQCKVTITRNYKNGEFCTNSVDCRNVTDA
jgi:hypothetical protein